MINPHIIFSHQFIITTSFPPPDNPPGIRISTDSRTIEKGDLFVALSGPQFNGLQFAKSALDRGALGVVFSKDQETNQIIPNLMKSYRNRFFIEVKETYEYLKSITMAHVSQWKMSGGRVLGITGSNGKTTTKEMLAFMIEGLIGDTLLYTKGNLNNQIGVPLTLCRLLLHQHKLAIIEMGTNQSGEIQDLCDIAMPDMGIITNTSKTHLEYLKNEEGVFQEKRALYDSVMRRSNNKGAFVLNVDGEYLRTLPQNKNVITFGEKFGTQKIQFNEKEVRINEIPLRNEFITGKHNFINLACSFLMAEKLFSDRVDELRERAAHFQPQFNRSSWIKHGHVDIFLDAYNANPISMKAAISSFTETVLHRKLKWQKILWIIGDMNELGDQAEVCHEELGETLRMSPAKNIVFVGRHYGPFKQGLQKEALHLKKISDFTETLGKRYLDSFDMVFIKGSRSLQLESLVDIK